MLAYKNIQHKLINILQADCADLLLDAFTNEASRCHRNVALSGTWAMANLADTLAKQVNGFFNVGPPKLPDTLAKQVNIWLVFAMSM